MSADLEPSWIDIARSQLGVTETPGPASNATIEGYHAATAGGPTIDGIPWCSSFVCWCIQASGIESTRSKSSQSWLSWGVQVPPIVGAVGVIKNVAQPGGHVGFVLGQNAEGMIVLLGGNQGDAVSIRAYARERFVSFRWPRLPQVTAAMGGSTR